MKKEVVALSLFSGGLDSILATRVVAAQGIRVLAVKFVSPFFGHDLLDDTESYSRAMKEKYDIEVIVEDISSPYLQLLHKPVHGFGKNFNPCVDCKIFMFTRARQMMEERGAAFLISGEVLWQRPMSQRPDTLNVIERDSGNRAVLLRPLSAKLMNPTRAELEGLVDREKLFDFSGRGRSRQIALAGEYGITDFPAPAGGCTLADPILSKRIADMYRGGFGIVAADISTADILLLLVGRQFRLPGGGWLILGRSEEENRRIVKLQEEGDIMLRMEDHPGPAALLRRFALSGEKLSEDLAVAAGLVVRYGKKDAVGPSARAVRVRGLDRSFDILSEPLSDSASRKQMI